MGHDLIAPPLALVLLACAAPPAGEGGSTRPPAGISESTVRAGGVDVHTLSAGPDDGRLVLLLHGARFRAATWQELGTLDHLAGAGHRAVAIDLPAFGSTPASDAEPATFLIELLDALGARPQAPAVVVSPSMSGRFSLPLLARSPDLFAGFVALAPVGIEEHVDELEGTPVPALLFWGSEDGIVPVALARELEGALPESRLVIAEGAGHPAYLDQPERFHQELLELLTRAFADR